MTGSTLPSPSPTTPRHSTTFVSQVQSAAYTPAQQEGVEIFKRGIDFAISRGLIIPNSAFHKKLNAFARRLGNGMGAEQAAGRSKLSGRTIEQIFNMGRSVPRPLIPTQDQTLVKAPVTNPVVEVKGTAQQELSISRGTGTANNQRTTGVRRVSIKVSGQGFLRPLHSCGTCNLETGAWQQFWCPGFSCKKI